jgi:hypothetical protein
LQKEAHVWIDAKFNTQRQISPLPNVNTAIKVFLLERISHTNNGYVEKLLKILQYDANNEDFHKK